MMIRKTLLAILVLFGLQTLQAQHLNSYQYVVIPAEFDFQKETNQYQLNELLKFLFEKEGFEAFLDNEPIPSQFSSNACKGLRARVRNESGMFRTRLYIELRDCNNLEVFVSREGVSKVKEYERAYQEALRAAFASISELNYSVEKEQNVVEVTAVPANPEVEVVEVTAIPAVPEEKVMEVPAVPAIPEEKEVKEEVEREIPVEYENPLEVDKEPTMQSGETGAKSLFFVKDGVEFFLEKIPSGYNLYQKAMAEPFASLIKSSAGESYIYASVTSRGMANFDKSGNLTVEILDPDTDKLKVTIYQKRD